MSTKVISREEFAKHNTKKSCWININSKVYDVTEWMRKHPGGERVLLCLGGRDATWNFIGNHLPEIERKYLPLYYIGDLQSKKEITEEDIKLKQITKEYKELLYKFEKEGYFNTNFMYYFWKCLLVILLLLSSFYAFYLSNKYNNFLIGVLASITFAMMWQQAAFIGHDLGHNAVFSSFSGNRIFGLFEADLLQGIFNIFLFIFLFALL